MSKSIRYCLMVMFPGAALMSMAAPTFIDGLLALDEAEHEIDD
ncbi:MAG TPA: hypothetical protein VMV33_16230 [Rhodocyclaceae bacterium]|nr:hypothetical protein [Rhodocyclaceae bacterium]